MAVNSHRGTVGHTIGTDIIGKENPSGTNKEATGKSPSMAQSFRAEKSANGGWSITHEPVSAKGNNSVGAESPIQSQLHVFRDAESAHGHIGAFMGVRIGSGARHE